MSGTEKILFLSGMPGIGKTNIVSKLCNKRNSIVKIRYYAYEPIQTEKEYLPMDVSDRVKKECFWNEIFSQLRQCLKGSLHKYNVPLQNCFMSLEEMKRKFFEIASAYAKNNDEIFVIAIDGIDHAARAGIGSETFLNTLPNPEYIPDNIKLLISGQPQESYSNYPSWLRKKNNYVKHLNVPGIERKDILSLVKQNISDNRISEYNVITDIIEEYSEKNTLAAIFAVYEATQCINAVELERKLVERKLSGNIEEYYSNIWSNAFKSLNHYDFIEYKLAGIFALLNERVDGNMLAEIFSDFSIPISDWNNILKMLKPLIVEKSGKYHVLHNDVKVFLSNIIKIDDERLQEIANLLTEYYLNKQDKSQAYYFDIVKLMSMAKRDTEIINIFSAKFVIEAYVNGVEISKLISISNSIMKRLLLENVIDYEKLQYLSVAIFTINKIDDTQKNEIYDFEFRDVKQYVAVASYECYVMPTNQWDAHLISKVLLYAKNLYYSGKKERAFDLFNRWFEGLDISSLWNILRDKGMLYTRNTDHKIISSEAKKISEDLGKLICWTKRYNMLGKAPEWSDEIFQFMGGLRTFWNEVVLNYKDEELKTAINYISVNHIPINPNVLIDILIKLIDDLNWTSINIIENEIRERLANNKLGILFDLFMRIVVGNVEDYDKYGRKAILDKIQDIELPRNYRNDEIYYYSIYAIVMSYLQPAKDRAIVTQKILDKFTDEYLHRDKNYYGAWFNCLCFIGYWLYAKHNKQTFLELPSEMEKILSSVILKQWSIRVTDKKIKDIFSLILKVYIILASQENETYKQSISGICEEVFKINPVNQVMDAGWYYYKDNVFRLKHWFMYWLGDEGKVWDKPIGDRNSIIKEIFYMVDKYQLGNIIDTSAVKEKAKWSVIGYASYKEYSLSDILDWYDSLIALGYEDYYKYAEKIKLLSNRIEELGDNGIAYETDCKMYGALFSNGLTAIKKILVDPVYMNELLKYPEYIIEGIIGYLKNANFSENELLSVWAFGIGMLNWKNTNNHPVIAELESAIETYAERNNIPFVYEKISKMGKAEISVCSNKNCNSTSDIQYNTAKVEVTIAETTSYFEQYMKMDKSKYFDDNKLLAELDAKRENRSVYLSYLENILKKELDDENYIWQNRKILEYAISNLPNTIADKYISSYVILCLENNINYYYVKDIISNLCLWKSRQCGQEYCQRSLDNLLNMHSLWISSAERINIQKENIDEETVANFQKVCSLLDVESVSDFKDLFMRLLIIFMLSDNSDVAESALRGLYRLLEIYPMLVNELEKYWDKLHYRAKEWLLMIYELLAETKIIDKNALEKIVIKHINDSYFNVALYSRLILENICGKNAFTLPKTKHNFFDDIPEYSTQRLMYINSNEQSITGTRYIMEILEQIEEKIGDECSDIEEKVAAYKNQINDADNIILDIGGTKQYCVALNYINVAFYRVMCKEWYKGRWNGIEIPLSHIVLSTSEPYILLQSPNIWPYQENKLLNMEIAEVEELDFQERENMIKSIFSTGISDGEIVLGGALIEYSYKKELIGFMTTYIDSPDMNRKVALYACERNARLLFYRKIEIEENKCNLLVHNLGVESFKNSSIMYMFPQCALNFLNWNIDFCDGLKIVDSQGKIIGRFEYFYGLKTDIGNRTYMNQPIIQRWIIDRDSFNMLHDTLPYNLKQVAETKIFETDYE